MTRDSVSRTLSVHTEHELLLALEKAGIAKLAQMIIESPNNAFALTIIKFCRDLAESIPTESQKDTYPGNGYNFTDRLRAVLALARKEASEYKDRYVSPEHLLLAIIREGDGRAVLVMTHLSVNLESIKAAVEKKLGQKSIRSSDLDIPYTSLSKKAIELAMGEARDMGHDYIGTEHLLLALVKEERSEISLILKAAGIDIQRVRDEVRRVVGKY